MTIFSPDPERDEDRVYLPNIPPLVSSPGYQPDKTRVAAGTAIIVSSSLSIKSEESILMLLRKGSHGEGKWAPPGGWISVNDNDAKDGASRELWEEVGLHCTAFDFIGYTTDHHDEGVKDVCLWFWTYLGRCEGKPRNTNPDRIAEIRWIDKPEIRRMYIGGELFLPLMNALDRDIL